MERGGDLACIPLGAGRVGIDCRPFGRRDVGKCGGATSPAGNDSPGWCRPLWDVGRHLEEVLHCTGGGRLHCNRCGVPRCSGWRTSRCTSWRARSARTEGRRPSRSEGRNSALEAEEHLCPRRAGRGEAHSPRRPAPADLWPGRAAARREPIRDRGPGVAELVDVPAVHGLRGLGSVIPRRTEWRSCRCPSGCTSPPDGPTRAAERDTHRARQVEAQSGLRSRGFGRSRARRRNRDQERSTRRKSRASPWGRPLCNIRQDRDGDLERDGSRLLCDRFSIPGRAECYTGRARERSSAPPCQRQVPDLGRDARARDRCTVAAHFGPCRRHKRPSNGRVQHGVRVAGAICAPREQVVQDGRQG